MQSNSMTGHADQSADTLSAVQRMLKADVVVPVVELETVEGGGKRPKVGEEAAAAATTAGEVQFGTSRRDRWRPPHLRLLYRRRHGR